MVNAKLKMSCSCDIGPGSEWGRAVHLEVTDDQAHARPPHFSFSNCKTSLGINIERFVADIIWNELMQTIESLNPDAVRFSLLLREFSKVHRQSDGGGSGARSGSGVTFRLAWFALG